MTKQEKIIEAYGKYWKLVKDFVDENGNCLSIDYSVSGIETKNHPPLNEMGIYQEDNFSDTWYDSKQYKHFWRPKSLEGIEDNNGWIPFTHEKLPPNTDYHVTNSRGQIIVLSSNVMNSITINSLADLTHYRPIPIPKPPVY